MNLFLFQRTGGLFGTNPDPFSSEPSSPTAAQTSQRPLQFSESHPEDVESPADSVFLPNTEFFPVTPTRANITNNNANFTDEWVPTPASLGDIPPCKRRPFNYQVQIIIVYILFIINWYIICDYYINILLFILQKYYYNNC